jgi:diguanylate cyclase (GGDEF)-like protein
VKYLQLAANAMPYVLGVKVLVIASAFVYVYSVNVGPPHGNAPLFWFTCIVLVGFNCYLYTQLSSDPQRRLLMFYFAMVLDLVASFYLFFPGAEALLAMLAVLALIIGFYSIVLPGHGGMFVGVVCILLYTASILSSLGTGEDVAKTALTMIASLVFGHAVFLSVMIVMRRIKQDVDDIYVVSDSLAHDLSAQAVNAEIAIEGLVERNREVQTLLQILENFVAVLDFDQLFENIIQAFRNRFDFDKFSIYLHNSETDHLDLRLESGELLGTGVAKSVRTDYGVVGWCFSHGEGVVINDVANDPRFADFNPRARKLRSLACQPLVFRGERLGVLCLDSEKTNSFDESTFAFLESVVPLISVAVSNSLQYSMTKEESLTDNLTKLYNHRGFMEKFAELLDTAYCDEIPMELVIIDIDHFKKINDTYGHLVGNVILTELANTLMGFFRGSDLVARYGGEEFVVVLNGTPPDIAPRIAEQLRRKVEAHQFPISLQRDAFRQVTISLGIATTMDTNLQPEIIRGSRGRDEADVFLRNREELSALIIDNADQALYAAKNEGRNQVMLSLHYPVSQASEPVISS